MKRALLIGASGFLGSSLLKELQQRHYEVFAVRNQREIPGLKSDQVIKGGISVLTADAIDSIKPDVVFHTARPVIPRLRKWGRMLAARRAASLNRKLLMELGNSASKPLLAFASGSLMYGNSHYPHNEDSELNPISFARQYYKGEIPIVEVAKQNMYPVQVFRLPWLLGNGSWFRWFYLNNIQKMKSIPKFGDAQNLMEIIDVRDAIRLMIRIAFENKTHGIINIPSAGAISQQQFLEKTAKVFNAQIVDYSMLYPGKVEKAVTEAYTSNIVLGSKYPEFFKGFEYADLENSLGLLQENL